MPVKIRLIAVTVLATLMTGCESTRWNWFKPNTDAHAKPGAGPTVAALVNYLNENAGRVRTLRVDELAIDASMGNQTIGLRGRIFAEKPRNFRMKVTALGKDEVDIGSNAQEFWFWAAKNPDPYQYFCSYQDLAEGRLQSMPLPVQPEWVMEALGLGPYGPAEKYTLEPEGAHLLRLVEKAKSPQGQTIRKVMVMNRREMKSPQPQITTFLLLDDATGQEICSAHITSTTVDRATGAILPYKMELKVPAQKMRMALKLDAMSVNQAIAGTSFVRQSMTGVQAFNLATGKVEPASFQRPQGFK